jgi:hypothetical protein
MNLIFPISVLFFASLVLWFMISLSRRYVLLAVIVAITSLFTVALWDGVVNTMGWAAPESAMPNKFMVQWVYVLEPDSARDINGGIFLWVTDLENAPRDFTLNLFGYTPDKNEPRSIRIPYSREMHEKMQGIQKMLRDGQKVVGQKRGDGKGKGKGDGKGDGDGDEGRGNGRKGKGRGDKGIGSEGKYEFYNLMRAKFPEKNPQVDQPQSEQDLILP